MRSRRFVLLFGLVVIGAACGQPAEAPAPLVQQQLFLRSARGVTVASTSDTSEPTYSSTDAVPSGDWSTAVGARVHKNLTTLVASDPTTGRSLWERNLDGQLQVKVVSYHGDRVALGPTTEWHHTQGRRRTDLVIVASNGYAPVQTLSLEGNYEPEAFSSDGHDLFVIEYLPAMQPTHYRVRSLDLTTGEVGGVYTVDEELQDSMRGTARVQAMAPDGGRLYTLYTERSGGEQHSFVHVLSLDEKWAHCVDLPEGFADAAETATALTLSDDGKRLFVANSVTDEVAEVDTEQLTVVADDPAPFADDTGTKKSHDTHAAHDGDHLFLAHEYGLASVDASTFEAQKEWMLDEPITGLQLSADGEQLFVGQKDEVVVLDIGTGEEITTIDPPGIGDIDVLGQTTEAIELLGGYKCGC